MRKLYLCSMKSNTEQSGADCPMLIEEFKLRLESNPQLTLAEFNREKGLQERCLQKWCSNHKVSIADMRREAKLKLRMINEPENRPGDTYSFVLDEYRKVVVENPALTLSKFCREQGVSPYRFQHWLNRQGLTATDVRLEAIKDLEFTEATDEALMNLSPAAITRFKKVLDEYKRQLKVSIRLSLREYCSERGVDVRMFRKWLETLGLSEQALKQDAKLFGKMVGGDAGSIFVQFRPNGMSNGDALRGVKIFFPNGGRIYVDRCTVISLCSFIQTYDRQQRRKGGGTEDV